MQKTIDAVFEDGVFKPVKKIIMREHTKLRLIILKEEDARNTAKKQSDALLSIAGIGSSGLKDVSEYPEKYLYGSCRE